MNNIGLLLLLGLIVGLIILIKFVLPRKNGKKPFPATNFGTQTPHQGVTAPVATVQNPTQAAVAASPTSATPTRSSVLDRPAVTGRFATKPTTLGKLLFDLKDVAWIALLGAGAVWLIRDLPNHHTMPVQPLPSREDVIVHVGPEPVAIPESSLFRGNCQRCWAVPPSKDGFWLIDKHLYYQPPGGHVELPASAGRTLYYETTGDRYDITVSYLPN